MACTLHATVCARKAPLLRLQSMHNRHVCRPEREEWHALVPRQDHSYTHALAPITPENGRREVHTFCDTPWRTSGILRRTSVGQDAKARFIIRALTLNVELGSSGAVAVVATTELAANTRTVDLTPHRSERCYSELRSSRALRARLRSSDRSG